MIKSIDPVAIFIGVVVSVAISHSKNDFHLFIPLLVACSAFIITVWEVFLLCINFDNTEKFNQIVQSRKYLVIGGLILTLVYELSVLLAPFNLSLLP